ncbi:MAG: hypothetical protein OXR66_05925 [Candidatus Woesearchaeota archaeon]|nr:hypothetical protein [Candidatus Woesearchaeota archaeon]
MIDETALKTAVADMQKDKKKFAQSYDLLFGLKDLNLKNPDEQVEFFATVPHASKKVKICALVGAEMIDDAKKDADHAVVQDDFQKLKKPQMRKLAKEYDFFVGQANIMPKIAGAFGRLLGPRGKMPNPKAGCIVPPKAPLKPLIERLQKIIKVSAKKAPSIQIRVATQDLSDAQVIENVKSVYDQVIHHLPKEENNVKAVYLKLTMSKPVKLK